MPTVVVDSSSIIHLAAIGQLELLRKLYGQILVTPIVWQEVVTEGRGRFGETELRRAVQDGWISIESPPSNIVVPVTLFALHPGELETIRLVISRNDALLMMDESAGRAVATGLGLKVIGIVGLLVLARQQNLIPNLSQELQRLRGPGRFRLSNSVIEQALRLAGEIK